ncbi:hypothetical protein Droror1_Dr00005769 [Drosera rotundifolia]
MMGLSSWMEILKQDNWGFDCGALRPVVLVKGEALISIMWQLRSCCSWWCWAHVAARHRSCFEFGSYARLQSCSKVRTSSGVLVWLRVEFGARSCSRVRESVRGVLCALELLSKQRTQQLRVSLLGCHPLGVLRVSPS